MSTVLALAWLALGLTSASGRALAAPPSPYAPFVPGTRVAVELAPGAEGVIDASALRSAIARELDATVTNDQPAFTVVVSIDRERGQLLVERRDGGAGLSRRVRLPATPEETLRAAVFLAGNLARDDAGEVLRDLRARSSAAAPEPPVTSSAPEAPRAPEPPRAPPPPPLVWIGVAGIAELFGHTSVDDVCVTPSSGYTCVIDNDVPAAAGYMLGKSDRVSGGLAPGNVRALISFDVAASGNVLVGGRVGYVSGTYHDATNRRSPFPPVHLEARATYVFGDAPLFHAGLAPYAYVAGGLAASSSSVDVTIIANPTTGPAPGPQTLTAKAWRVAGAGFGAASVGARWATTDRFAATLGARFGAAVGDDGTVLIVGLEAGLAWGL